MIGHTRSVQKIVRQLVSWLLTSCLSRQARAVPHLSWQWWQVCQWQLVSRGCCLALQWLRLAQQRGWRRQLQSKALHVKQLPDA